MMRTRLKRMVDQFTGEKYWKDPVAGIQFRRIVIGLAWPFDTLPGAVVVLGEVRSMDPHTHTHKVQLLHDRETNGIDELIRCVWGVATDCGVFDMVSRRDVPEIRFVDAHNRQLAARRSPQIRIIHPQEGDDRERFRFWVRLLERRTLDDKTMIFGASECVRNRLLSLTTPDYAKEPEEFPAVSAFLFALAEIDLHQPIRIGKFSQSIVDTLAGY